MAGVRAEVEFNLDGLIGLKLLIPELSGRLLQKIGANAKDILKNDFYKGQEINVPKDKDKLGRRLITYDVNKTRKFVKVYSYPANLFEEGRKLRSGEMEPAKHIIRVKLKNAVTSRLAGYVADFERQIVKEELAAKGLT